MPVARLAPVARATSVARRPRCYADPGHPGNTAGLPRAQPSLVLAAGRTGPGRLAARTCQPGSLRCHRPRRPVCFRAWWHAPRGDGGRRDRVAWCAARLDGSGGVSRTGHGAAMAAAARRDALAASLAFYRLSCSYPIGCNAGRRRRRHSALACRRRSTCNRYTRKCEVRMSAIVQANPYNVNRETYI